MAQPLLNWKTIEPDPQVVALVGSYRKGGIIDSLVDEMLSVAAENNLAVGKIYLSEVQIEFCRNCRHCTQSPGPTRGGCDLEDEMTDLLEVLDRAEGLILASPVNFFTVTALTKRFVERLVCGAYWPWGKMGPALRVTRPQRPALLVSSCAMPAFLARLVTNNLRVLKSAAAALGVRPVGSLIVGLVARSEHQPLSGRARRKARRLGRKLIAALSGGN
jgi:hypothetical protein